MRNNIREALLPLFFKLYNNINKFERNKSMVTSAQGDRVYEYRGKSTDTKPVNASIENGSVFIEMDTSKVFMFDKDRFEIGEDPWKLFE